MTLIKICGITTVDDALEAARFGVDIIGLVFAESPRRVASHKAEEISFALSKLSPRPAIAGVFVNENPQMITEMAGRCRLDIIQLSGDESYEYCKGIDFPVIKAVHVSRSDDAASIMDRLACLSQIKLDQPLVFLLDTKMDARYGGTGKTFDWDIAKGACAVFPVIMAGGLNPGNAGDLVQRIKPLGLDVSSGVETKGRKDVSKIKAFIEVVRSADINSENSDYINKYILKGEKNAAR